MLLSKPRPLQRGDLIALVSPSGPAPREGLEAGMAYLEGRGYRIRPGRHLFARHHYLAGTDQQRAADLGEAFADPQVRAVFCARGGYGAGRLLDRLDYAAVALDPKIVLGFSDTTALHLALQARCGLVCFTGGLVSMDLADERDPFTEEWLWRSLSSAEALGALPLGAEFKVLRPGRASGPLLGGCLSLLCSLLGTSYVPDLSGAILLLEDVDEYPYRLDRMLNHLRLAGVLECLGGLVLGQFKDCFIPEETGRSPNLEEMVMELTEGLDLPVVAGVPYGHFKRRLVLPLGVEAVLDTYVPQLSLVESAFRVDQEGRG
ncbi:MAG: LD-carboxypeptidase [Candidatus Latescibacteria bacterium]|nr:LD-carboxypeptidase [Candidatus Latescibacterota bacterium]